MVKINLVPTRKCLAAFRSDSTSVAFPADDRSDSTARYKPRGVPISDGVPHHESQPYNQHCQASPRDNSGAQGVFRCRLTPEYAGLSYLLHSSDLSVDQLKSA